MLPFIIIFVDLAYVGDNAVQEVPNLLNYVHMLSGYVLPFAKY